MEIVLSPGGALPEKTRLAKEMEARQRWMEERKLVQSGLTSGNTELVETIMNVRSASASVNLSTSLSCSKVQPFSLSTSAVIPEEHLTCAICYEVFSHPVALTCGHVFCKDCVKSVYKSNEQYRLHCPLCKKQCESLSKIYVLNSISESVRLSRSMAKSEAEGKNKEDAVEENASAEFPTQLDIDILLKRISIATDAIKKCSQKVQSFNKLTQSYYSSIRKIDDKISQLKEQKELMTTEYKKVSTGLEKTIEKEKVLHSLIESLETELNLKKIMLQRTSPAKGDDAAA